VLADESLAQKRFCQTGHTPDEYKKRMSRQWQPKEKAKRANYTLTNNGSLAELRQEVVKLNSILKEN